MGSERPTYTLTVLVPRRRVVQLSLTHQMLHLPPTPRLTHQLVQLQQKYRIRLMKPSAEGQLLPPALAAWNINETLATLNPIDVSVVRSKLLIHAKKHKYTLHLQDLLTHFRQVFQSEEDVQYFLTVLGDGWFIPKTPGVWRIQHPEWWR